MHLCLGLFLSHSIQVYDFSVHLSHSNEMEYDFSASMFRRKRGSSKCATKKYVILFFP